MLEMFNKYYARVEKRPKTKPYSQHGWERYEKGQIIDNHFRYKSRAINIQGKYTLFTQSKMGYNFQVNLNMSAIMIADKFESQ